MKKLFYIFLFFSSSVFAQNLVPNPSFEDTLTCPNSEDQVYKAAGWNKSGNGTPDYFNSCSDSLYQVSVPSNGFGYQNAPTGNAYCGLYTYVKGLSTFPNYREYIGGNLSIPLIIGQKYYIYFKINLGESSTCASDNIGVFFSTIPYYYDYTIPTTIKNYTHLNDTTIETDSLGWTTKSGSFISDSAYQYIVIGNFFSDSLTNYVWITATNICGSYYFIDDICLSTDSLYCDSLTGFNDLLFTTEIILYPNPTEDKINILLSDKRENAVIKIYNLFGELIYQDKVASTKNIVNISNHSAGVYVVKIQIENQITYQKLILTK